VAYMKSCATIAGRPRDVRLRGSSAARWKGCRAVRLRGPRRRRPRSRSGRGARRPANMTASNAVSDRPPAAPRPQGSGRPDGTTKRRGPRYAGTRRASAAGRPTPSHWETGGASSRT
jgi:hypothetical protein